MNRAEFKIDCDIELWMSIYFFCISNFSRMLSLIGVPRAIPYIFYIILFVGFLVCRPLELRNRDIIYSIAVIPMVIYGVYRYASYIESSTSIYATIILFLPSYYFFRFCPEEKIWKGFRISVFYSLIYLLFYYMIYVRTNSTYSMSYAYWIAIPMCAVYYYYLKERKSFQLVLFLLSFLTLILSGCRGALGLSICCILFYMLFCEFDGSSRTKRWIIVGGILLLILANADHIVDFLSQYTDVSRNIKKLLEGSFFDTTSRSELYLYCRELISLNFWGYGTLASRKLITDYPYPHSIYYELQLDYGRIVGLLILAYIIWSAYRLLKEYRRYEAIGFIGPLIIIGIGSLFVSSSLYQEYYIPALIGLAVRNIYEVYGGAEYIEN